jgi:hypothetical protein
METIVSTIIARMDNHGTVKLKTLEEKRKKILLEKNLIRNFTFLYALMLMQHPQYNLEFQVQYLVYHE